MGTRADFYVGRSEQAEWLGSIAWDGYPDGLPDYLKVQTTEADWRAAVERFFRDDREDVTRPADGWPWPWENSLTTDYSYAFDGGMVYGTCFGHGWFLLAEPEPEDQPDDKTCVFPYMSTARHAPAGSKRSGVMVFGSRGPV